jgi:hypothetical protein
MATTLAPAVVDGKHDALHPLAKRWLAQRPQRGPRPGYHPPAPPASEGGPAPENLSLRKKAAEVAILEAKVARDDRSLVSRRLVELHVFGLVDSVFKRLIGDLPQTVAARLTSAVRAGTSSEEQVALVRSIVSTELGNLKRGSVRAVRRCDASGPLEPPEELADEHVIQETARIRAFAEALRAELSSSVVPHIVDLVSKTIARQASGRPWTPTVFNEAMQVAGEARVEATRAATSMLSAAVTEVLQTALAVPDKEGNNEKSQ